MVEVSDADLLLIADEFRLPETKPMIPNGIVDAGSQFGRRMQAGRSRDEAMAATLEWIAFYYGPRP